jgi:hypothetical protein
VCLCLGLRPRQDRHQQAIRWVSMVPAILTAKTTRSHSSFEAQWQASALAVYASQDGLLHHHARLASGGWPDLAR